MFEFEPLYKKRKRKKGKKGGERKLIYLFIYLFIYILFLFYFIYLFIIIIILFIYLFIVLYDGTSGLHAHTHGHAWLGEVRSGLLLLTRSRWNAVRCYGIQFVYQC